MTTASDKEIMLAAIEPGDIVAYLQMRGWREADSAGSAMARFQGPEDDAGDAITVLVPTSVTLRDYALRLHDLLEALAAVEERPLTSIVRDVAFVRKDILHVRVSSPETTRGSAPLNVAAGLIENTRRALAAAAASVIHGPSMHYSPLPKDAYDFANSCHLVALNPGSIDTAIEIPGRSETEQERPSTPFSSIGREVVGNMMMAMFRLKSDFEIRDATGSLRAGRIDVSANICDAFAKLARIAGDGLVELSLSWHGPRPDSLGNAPDVISFEGYEARTLATIASELRHAGGVRRIDFEHEQVVEPKRIAASTKKEPERTDRREWEFEGRIVSLRVREPDRGPGGGGVAEVQGEMPDQPGWVSLDLQPDLYRLTCEALAADQPVRISGVFERRGDSPWRLVTLLGLTVIKQENR